MLNKVCNAVVQNRYLGWDETLRLNGYKNNASNNNIIITTVLALNKQLSNTLHPLDV